MAVFPCARGEKVPSYSVLRGLASVNVGHSTKQICRMGRKWSGSVQPLWKIVLELGHTLREIPAVKVLHADRSKRIVLPSPAKPLSAWVPVLVTEKEIRLVAYEPPKRPSLARGKVVMGKDGWPVWQGEMVMDPVLALNQDRAEDADA